MKLQRRNDENSQPEMNHSSGNGSGVAVGRGSQSVDTKQTGSSLPADKKTRSSPVRRATRPGTPETARVGNEESSAHSLVVHPPAISSPNPARKATGPRTPQGKQRSSQNSLNHGVFSRAVLLKGESAKEFRGLRAGLFEDFHPCGATDELLVDKLVELEWRLNACRTQRSPRGCCFRNALLHNGTVLTPGRREAWTALSVILAIPPRPCAA
jgi:hypothetical protein